MALITGVVSTISPIEVSLIINILGLEVISPKLNKLS
jgi:hypothetical protein